MGWNVYAVRARRGAALDDLPVGRHLPVIGTADEVAERVRRAAPHVDSSNPTWLTLDAPDHSIEMFLGKDVHVREISFYVRSGDGAREVVLDVCRALGVTPYETESGELLTESTALPSPPPDDKGKRRWWRR